MDYCQNEGWVRAIEEKKVNLELLSNYFERLKTKDVYAWGSGKYFRNHTLPFLRTSGLEVNFKGHVDKEQLIQMKDDNVLVIIAVVGYKEILSQFNNNTILAKFMAVPSIFLEALYEDMMMLLAPKPPLNYRKNKSITIPKTIHTFWFSDQKEGEEIILPERYEKCLLSWKKYAPDYDIKIWNQYSYHAKNCLFYEQAIEKKCWAFASDYARADVLRRFGGVYMDLDVEMIKPIDNLLYNDAYMSFESLERIECGSGMGAKAGNKILDEICKDYESRPFVKEDGSLDMSTCPVRFTNVIAKHGLVKNGGFQIVEDITVYPFEYLTGKSFDTGIVYSSDLAYSLHHHNGSWVPGNTQQSMNERYEDIARFCTNFSYL